MFHLDGGFLIEVKTWLVSNKTREIVMYFCSFSLFIEYYFFSNFDITRRSRDIFLVRNSKWLPIFYIET